MQQLEAMGSMAGKFKSLEAGKHAVAPLYGCRAWFASVVPLMTLLAAGWQQLEAVSVSVLLWGHPALLRSLLTPACAS